MRLLPTSIRCHCRVARYDPAGAMSLKPYRGQPQPNRERIPEVAICYWSIELHQDQSAQIHEDHLEPWSSSWDGHHHSRVSYDSALDDDAQIIALTAGGHVSNTLKDHGDEGSDRC
jgi:hypothetical protein